MKTRTRYRFCHEDLYQEGCLGLLDRADFWVRHPGLTYSFEAYVIWEIRTRLRSHARSLVCPVKVSAAAASQVGRLKHGRPLTGPRHLVRKAQEALELNCELFHPIASGEASHDQPIEAPDYHRFDDLYAALERLPKQERALIDELYGLSQTAIAPHEAAVRRGVSMTRISQRRRMIEEKLRIILADLPERDFFPRGKEPLARWFRCARFSRASDQQMAG
jgi:RNA polymerase sigma factor (sigma-70 family)